MSALAELRQIYERASVISTGDFFTTVNSFTDQVEPLSASLLRGLADLIVESTDKPFNVVVGEEDKGAHIATAVSLRADVPLTLARIYQYSGASLHPTSVAVEVHSEYQRGTLVLNGLTSYHDALLVEDTISTGGTIVSLIRAIRSQGARIVRCVAVVEKLGPNGVSHVGVETGIQVETLIRIRTTETGVLVE